MRTTILLAVILLLAGCSEEASEPAPEVDSAPVVQATAEAKAEAQPVPLADEFAGAACDLEAGAAVLDRIVTAARDRDEPIGHLDDEQWQMLRTRYHAAADAAEDDDAWAAFWSNELGSEGMFSSGADDPTAGLLARDRATLEALIAESSPSSPYYMLSAIDTAIADGSVETARWLIGEIDAFELNAGNRIALGSFYYRLGDRESGDEALADLGANDVSGSWGLAAILRDWIDRDGLDPGLARFVDKFGHDAVGGAIFGAIFDDDPNLASLVAAAGVKDFLGKPSTNYSKHGAIIALIERFEGAAARDDALNLVLPNILEDDALSVLGNLSSLALMLTRHGCSAECLAPLAEASREVEYNVPGSATNQTEIVPLEIDAARGQLAAVPPDTNERVLVGLINHAATYAVAHNDLDYVEPLVARLGYQKQDEVLGHLVNLMISPLVATEASEGADVEADAVRIVKRASMENPQNWSSVIMLLPHQDGFETLRRTLLIERLNSCAWPS